MMAVWSLLGDRTLKSFNAPRTLLVCAANTVAVFIFIAANAVRWREALVMLAGAIVGGYCGANIGRSAPAGIIRVGTLLLSWALRWFFSCGRICAELNARARWRGPQRHC